MKFKATLSKLLNNVWVLNIVFALSFLFTMYYLITSNIRAVIYLLVIGLILGLFTTNMIITLGVPIIVVNLMELYDMIQTKRETPIIQELGHEYKYNKQIKESFKNKDSEGNESKTPQGLPRTKIDNNMALNSSLNSIINSNTDETFEVGRAKRSKGYEIDYASTVEDAYDNLNKLLGSDGIKRLTNDTQKLIKKQAQLAESMNNMTPLIENITPLLEEAKGIMGGLDGKQ
jgi:hypothetical protein